MTRYQRAFLVLALLFGLAAFASEKPLGSRILGAISAVYVILAVISIWRSRPRWPKYLNIGRK